MTWFWNRRARFLVFAVVVAGIASSCQRQHPIKVKIDPAFETGSEKIAVFPFLTAIHEAEDPDGLASATMNKYFKPALDGRKDYKFISPNTLSYAVEQNDLGAGYRKFVAEYPKSGKADPEFLGALADALRCDAFLIPVVDMWQKDEVDYQENATPSTFVGASIVVVDRTGSKVLFHASDENYIEGAPSEAGDRGVISSAGRVRSDEGAKTHRAPPYEEVAIMVINALVGSLPTR